MLFLPRRLAWSDAEGVDVIFGCMNLRQNHHAVYRCKLCRNDPTPYRRADYRPGVWFILCGRRIFGANRGTGTATALRQRT